MKTKFVYSKKPIKGKSLQEIYDKIKVEHPIKTAYVQITCRLEPELDKTFRELIIKKFGALQQNLQPSIAEAVKLWIEVNKK